jgi:cytoskeletal protein CcmA (bactofilin family)
MDERRRAAWIGGSILVKGDVVSTEDLVIDGQVQGTIELGDHNLTIGSGASVVADLVANNITISGEVKGDVVGSGTVELKSSAKVEGDINAPNFMMEEGATLSGKVDTGTKTKKP